MDSVITFEFSASVSNPKYINYSTFHSRMVDRILELKEIMSPNDTVVCSRTNTIEDDTLPFLLGWEPDYENDKTVIEFVASCVVHDKSMQDIVKFSKLVQSHMFPYVHQFCVKKTDGEHIENIIVTEHVNELCIYDVVMENDKTCTVVNYGLGNERYKNHMRKSSTYMDDDWTEDDTRCKNKEDTRCKKRSKICL